MTLDYAQVECDGLCESPHDNPPKWAAMLTMYLDESIEQNDGYVVIAGFLGKRSAWVRCVRLWRKGLGKTKNLHMKELRGWKTDRHKLLLERMGKIPDSCGLTLVFCSVKVSDYRDLVKGTIVEIGNEGYMMALRFLVIGIMNKLPPGERLEVICENQGEYASRREFTFGLLSSLPEYQDKNGYSKLAKWSSIPKSTILEPSDYACYASLQKLRDPDSRKAILCSPILATNKWIGCHMSRDHARSMIAVLKENIGDFMPVEREKQKIFVKVLAQIVEQI